jgi:hypothetical protein
VAAGPYAPPKSKVNDVFSDAPKYRLRTKWLYFSGFLVALAVIHQIQEVFVPYLSAGRLTVGFILALLVSALSIGPIVRRRSGSSSLWRDLLQIAAFSPVLVGAFAEDELLIVVGFSSALVMFGLMALTVYMVEVWYSVRIYSRGRQLVFVRDSDAS